MNLTTFYFSGTGNTKWAVNELHKNALARGHFSNIYSIEDPLVNLEDLIINSDIIGISFPVYAMNIPDIMKQFLRRIGKIVTDKGICKNLFVITTVGYVDGCGPYEVTRKMMSRNIKLTGYISIKIADNTPALKSKIIPEDEFLKRLDKGKQKIDVFLDHLEIGKKSIASGIYKILAFRRKMDKITAGAYKKFSIDPITCTQCMNCVNNCPTKSINNTNGNLSFMSTCTACMRCYNECPTYSIWHDGKYADPAIYSRYKGPSITAES